MAVKGSFSRPDIDNDEILRLIREGFSQQRISEMFNCSPSLIQSRVRIFGWEKGALPRPKRVKPRGRKMCTCCGRKPVPTKPLPGGIHLTRLCSECYRLGGRLSDVDHSGFTDVKTAISMTIIR